MVVLSAESCAILEKLIVGSTTTFLSTIIKCLKRYEKKKAVCRAFDFFLSDEKNFSTGGISAERPLITLGEILIFLL